MDASYINDILSPASCIDIADGTAVLGSKEFEKMKELWDFHYHGIKKYRIPEPYNIMETYSGFLMNNIENLNLLKTNMIRDFIFVNSFFSFCKTLI